MNKKNSTLSGGYIAGFVDGEGCFDLQFRRDVRRDRLNSPVYYGWRYQFVIVTRADDVDLLIKIKEVLGCGSINFSRLDQARYSVQDINNIQNIIIPFFKKYPLSGKKRKDFELWAEAIEIISRNKKAGVCEKGVRGFTRLSWRKPDFERLIKIQGLMRQYKSKRPQGYKWLSAAESIAKTLE